MSKFAQFDSDRTFAAAMQYAYGDYQENLLRGVEAYSGSTLKGTAKKWGAKYRRSALALIARLRNAGFEVDIVIGPNRRHVLSVARRGQDRHVCLSGDLRSHGEPSSFRCVSTRPQMTVPRKVVRQSRIMKPFLVSSTGLIVRTRVLPELGILGGLRPVRARSGEFRNG
jgi:hypothetical protein